MEEMKVHENVRRNYFFQPRISAIINYVYDIILICGRISVTVKIFSSLLYFHLGVACENMRYISSWEFKIAMK